MKIKSWIDLTPGTIIEDSVGHTWIIDQRGRAHLLEGVATFAWTPDRSEKFHDEFGPFNIVSQETP